MSQLRMRNHTLPSHNLHMVRSTLPDWGSQHMSLLSQISFLNVKQVQACGLQRGTCPVQQMHNWCTAVPPRHLLLPAGIQRVFTAVLWRIALFQDDRALPEGCQCTFETLKRCRTAATMAGLVTLYCRAGAALVADIFCVNDETCECKKGLGSSTGRLEAFHAKFKRCRKQPVQDPSEIQQAQKVMRCVGSHAKTYLGHWQ